MKALAMTEHGNPASHAAAEQAAKKHGLKAIYGLEAYGGPAIRQAKFKKKTHQTILAMNQVGYENLNKIITQSYRDFYQFPTVTWENLKEHNDGLIVTSGCASSLTSCKLLGGKFYGEERLEYTDKQFEHTLRVIRQYRKVFGDRYYLEVQRFPQLSRIRKINEALEKISAITGIPLLATADVHYCHESDGPIQQALHAIHRGSGLEKIGADWEYDIPLTLPESDDEIIGDLIATGLSEQSAISAVENTSLVADRCNVVLPKSEPLRFPIPGLISREEYFQEQIEAGIEYRAAYGKLCDGADYQARIAYEISVMTLRPEFIDYFLFLSDLICWAKDCGIVVGPGRGSAAASLVCYLLRITEIDPMTVPTMDFTRFMDPSRTDLPDIDIDISDEDRYKLVDYLREKYGYANVGSVANVIRYRGRSAIDKIGIICRIPKATLKPLKERIIDKTETDDRVDDSLADAIARYGDDPEIKPILDNWPQIEQIGTAIEGDVQTLGTHAAGYVVASRPITSTTALLAKESQDGFDPNQPLTIPYDKRDAEYLGMMKADLLGLSTCGMIDKALNTINELKLVSKGLHLPDIYAMEYDDPEILRGFRENDLTGIFQFEGGTTRGVCAKVQPYTILDLSDINALSRPGPLFSGAVDRYVKAKHGELDAISYHELYDQHVEQTYGQLVYQEQIMKVLRDVAGFDTIKVLRVRKIIGKKLGEFQFAQLWEEFKDGCLKTAGIDGDTAWEIWSSITTAAGYAFNIAHSYAYSVIAYWAMYFKQNHPEAFFAASLAKNGDTKQDIPRRTALLKDTKAFGRDIPIRPLSYKLSRKTWAVGRLKSGKLCLRPGFLQVPMIGEVTSEALVSEQQVINSEIESGTLEGINGWDLLGKRTKGVGAAAIKNFKEFASSEDPFGVLATEKQLQAFRDQLHAGDFEGVMPEAGEFFTSTEISTSAEPWELVAWVGLVANIHYRDAVEYERQKTGKSTAEILEEMDDSDLVKHAVVFAYDEFDEVAIRFGRKIYPRWQSMLSQLKEDHHIIAVVGKKMPGMGQSIIPNNVWVLDPD